jgi:hypothetical protein
MITDRQKQSILTFVNNLPMGQISWFNEFLEDERDYLITLIENQTGRNGWVLETNGTAKDKTTITKFRKIKYKW